MPRMIQRSEFRSRHAWHYARDVIQSRMSNSASRYIFGLADKFLLGSILKYMPEIIKKRTLGSDLHKRARLWEWDLCSVLRRGPTFQARLATSYGTFPYFSEFVQRDPGSEWDLDLYFP